MAFVLNPYLGDVNPGTADGLKLYTKAVAAPEKKIAIDQQHAREIKDTFEDDANNFGWGPAVGSIQIDNAAPAPNTRSILTQVRDDQIQLHDAVSSPLEEAAATTRGSPSCLWRS